jgi:CBS domain-containing protein
MRYIVCRFCGHENPTGGDTCENCGAEFNEGMPEPPASFEGRLLGAPLGSLAGAAPIWMDGGASALDAVARMQADGADVVLVGDGRRPAGIFTDRDAMLQLPGRPGPAPALQDVMTRDPVILRPDDTVAVGIHKMAIAGIRHVPLADESGVTAVVAARDIFRHLVGRLGPVAGASPEPANDGVRTARPAVPTD